MLHKLELPEQRSTVSPFNLANVMVRKRVIIDMISDAETWLQRLTARGIKPKIVQDCASKVATVDPPYGCAFGVACIGDDDSYWRTADGAIDLPKTYLAYYNYKRGIFKRPMRWRKQAKPPPEIEEWNTMGVSKCDAHASSFLGF